MEEMVSLLDCKRIAAMLEWLQPRALRLLKQQKVIAALFDAENGARYRSLSDEAAAAVESIDPARLSTLFPAARRFQSILIGGQQREREEIQRGENTHVPSTRA